MAHGTFFSLMEVSLENTAVVFVYPFNVYPHIVVVPVIPRMRFNLTECTLLATAALMTGIVSGLHLARRWNIQSLSVQL